MLIEIYYSLLFFALTFCRNRSYQCNRVHCANERRCSATIFSHYAQKEISGGIVGQPIKAMIFMDGTWLYYNLVQDRDGVGPIIKKYGYAWSRKFNINWKLLPALISESLNRQLSTNNFVNRYVEIVRTSVFTSMRSDTVVGCPREKMLEGFYQANFDVHKFETKFMTEKCVDIALAVEMLYMTTIPDAYDIAIIVTGDKDFLPVLEKVRLRAKRVAICSVRNNCNKDLIKAESRTRDFEMIWLDDLVNQLLLPKSDWTTKGQASESEKKILDIIVNSIKENDGQMLSRSIGRVLQDSPMGNGENALILLKSSFQTLRQFLARFPDIFTISSNEDSPEFSVSLIQLKEDSENDVDREDDADISETDEAYLLGKAVVTAPDNEDISNLKFNISKEGGSVPYEIDEVLQKIVIEELRRLPDPYPSRELGRKLKAIMVKESIYGMSMDALKLLKMKHNSLYSFIISRKEYFDVKLSNVPSEFLVILKKNSFEEDEMEHEKVRDEQELKRSQEPKQEQESVKIEDVTFAETVSSAMDSRRSELERVTVKELRDILKAAGLPHSGTKSKLIDKILAIPSKTSSIG